jgi:predicted nucleic acid-binding protein
VNGPSDGLIDTNVFLHAQTTDAHSDECRRFLAALEQGTQQAWLEPLVLHELSYAFRHYVKQATKDDVASYMLTVLGWPGVRGDKDVMVDAVERWSMTPGLAFVDAYLAALAHRHGAVVYTMNVRELSSQGVSAPRPLPS